VYDETYRLKLLPCSAEAAETLNVQMFLFGATVDNAAAEAKACMHMLGIYVHKCPSLRCTLRARASFSTRAARCSRQRRRRRRRLTCAPCWRAWCCRWTRLPPPPLRRVAC
jgi:hypothetical protein